MASQEGSTDRIDLQQFNAGLAEVNRTVHRLRAKLHREVAHAA